MAVVFDSTVGGTFSNSYATTAEYQQYLENHGLTIVITADAEIELIIATAFIESKYRDKWKTRSKTTATQALHWPQDGATIYDGTEIADNVIPDQVKIAVYEYAITRSAQSQTTLSPVKATNVKKQLLEGVGELEFFGQQSGTGLPDDFLFIDEILKGLISSFSSGIRFLTAQRAS